MKTSKTVIESIAVASLAMALAITAVTGNGVSTVKNVTVAETQADENGVDDEVVSIEKVDAELVTATDEEEDSTESTETTLTEEELQWQDKLMVKVDDYVNVRAEADADAEIVGKMYKGDCATIEEAGSEWTKISSGNVTGYVNNENCVTGSDALAYAKKTCNTIAKVMADGVCIRKTQSIKSASVKTVNTGKTLTVNTKAETEEGWVAVKVSSKTYYVLEKYVTLSLKTGKAVTLKEDAANKKAEAKKTASRSTGYSATEEEEYLLAAIIQCEADGQSKNGMIAVGAVVLNRVKSSSFPNTISKVIYQRGQFGPASSGKLARRLARGVSSSAKEAAKAALAGSDPTGGAKYFKMASSGHAGVVIGPVVFY